ncbi:YitT family protein, partial [Streptococcus danieliae]|nr:YitT family protein [Streptococcus danieliae]
IVIGSIIYAAGLEFFLVPNKILDGGVVGISMIAQHYLHLPLGIFLVVLNMPFVYLGYKQIGTPFALASIFGIITMSIFTNIFHPYPPLIVDPFLACIFGGITLGLGAGLVIRAGGTLDGTDMFSIY